MEPQVCWMLENESVTDCTELKLEVPLFIEARIR